MVGILKNVLPEHTRFPANYSTELFGGYHDSMPLPLFFYARSGVQFLILVHELSIVAVAQMS